MKAVKDNLSGKPQFGKRYPILQKFLSALLCACLLLVSLPMEFYGFEVQAEEPRKKVLSFSDLPQEIKRQTLEQGTPLENLNLPGTLEAVCISLENDFAGNQEPFVQPETGFEMQGAALGQENFSQFPAPDAGLGTEDNQETDMTESPEPEPEAAGTPEPEAEAAQTPEPEAVGTPEPEPEAAQTPEPEAAGTPEPEPNANPSPKETVWIENVTWTSVPSYNPKAEGVYVFTPVLPEQYALAEGVPLPEIQVTIKHAEGSQREREIPKPDVKRQKAGVRLEEETEGLKRYEEEPGNEDSLIAPAAADIVITEDTSWGRTKLTGNLVIEEGATLTINDDLNISGNVTIRGKGTIARGNANAQIYVFGNGSLTMQEITVDGKGLEAPSAMIYVTGTLKVEAGCKIHNCHTRGYSQYGSTDGYGGAVYLFWSSRAKAELLDCTISNCTASYGGAAFCSGTCALTLDKGCRIENCRAVRRIGDDATGAAGNGGAIVAQFDNASLKLLDCTISHCSAEGDGGAIHCGTMNVTLGKGCKIEDCSAANGGAVMLGGQTKTDFQGIAITHCSAKGYGGAVYCGSSTLKINEDCKIQQCSAGNGGAVYNESSKLYISGGEFSDNTAANSGGAIFHSNTAGTETYLSGGTFQGNSCTSEKYAGSGGACLSSEGTKGYETHFEMSGNVKFYGDGTKSGVDSIYLDSRNAMPRKILLNGNLGNPVTVYLEAEEHYVIAKGTGDCTLTEADRKKISFVDVGTSGKRWGKRLDEGQNEIYLTETEYKTFSADFYSGGPEPSEPVCEEREVEKFVTEETIEVPLLRNFPNWEPQGWSESSSEYTAGIREDGTFTLTGETREYYGIYRREATLSYDVGKEGQEPPPESKVCYANVHKGQIGYQKAVFTIEGAPAREGCDFLGWSTQEGGQVPQYQPEDTLETTDDTVLYAVYQEKGKRTFLANFYSGDPVQIQAEMATEEETATEGAITAPLLKDFPGWEPLGWSTSKTGHEADLLEQGACILREPLTEYYGIYRKNITLTYDPNGGSQAPASETKPSYANIHQEVAKEFPEFTFAPAVLREGYAFVGWNTAPDGSGTLYEAGTTEALEQDTRLYAVWQEVLAPYRVEHYCQALVGEGYSRMDNDTENLIGPIGKEVEAQPKTYFGFAVNSSHPSGKPKGNVEADGSLALKLYYDRNIYEVDFHLNGGYGAVPAPQKIRYGGLLEKVSDPLRVGYNFKGWYLEEEGMKGNLWDFDSPVENNTGKMHTTLYAGWADELAPDLGEAAFSKGHQNFLDWIMEKQALVITVPVTEEGSGLAEAKYLLVSENGTEKEGEAQFQETHALADSLAAYGTSATLIRGVQEQAEHGKYEVRFTIEEEFKGKVYLTCTDHAGNVSAQKILTAEGGGVIVEDNAPDIHFSNTKETTGGKPLEVKVTVKDDMEGHVTGGISRIRYMVDERKKKTLPKEDFADVFVEEYEFTVEIRGEGKHTLRVEAADHVGNESAAKITLKINGKRDVPAQIPNSPPDGPLGGEPKTGEVPQVQIYATIAMITGFSYLLLYFQEENGISQQEKEEIIYRLVSWARQGGSIRRMLGLAVIFLFLLYYHSIGKSVDVEWKEMHGK